MADSVRKVPRHTSPERKREIYDAYIAAGRRNVDALAKQLGTTKTTIYNVRREFEDLPGTFPTGEIPPSVVAEGPRLADLPGPVLDLMTRNALITLLDQYVECRSRVSELEVEVDKLRRELELYRGIRTGS